MEANLQRSLAESEIMRLLMGGDRRSLGNSGLVVENTLAFPSNLEYLIPALEHPSDLARMRAADALEKISRVKIDSIEPFKNDLLAFLNRVQQAEVKWHLAQILPRFKWGEPEAVRMFGVFTTWLGDDSRIVRTFALQAMADLSESFPALKKETIVFLREAEAGPVASLSSRARKILKKWK